MLTSVGYGVIAVIAVTVAVVYAINGGLKGNMWIFVACAVVFVMFSVFTYLCVKKEAADKESLIAEGFDRGYYDGYDEGYDEGYDDGEFDGYESGYEDGYFGGRADGYGEGYSEGYVNGEYDALNP